MSINFFEFVSLLVRIGIKLFEGIYVCFDQDFSIVYRKLI